MNWSSFRPLALLAVPVLVVASACKSGGSSNTHVVVGPSLYAELQVLIDNLDAIDQPVHASTELLSSLIDETYDGEVIYGVQEFGASIDGVKLYGKESIKKQTAKVRSLWQKVASRNKSTIKKIGKTDPAGAAKETAELNRETALFTRVEDSMEPVLGQLGEIQTALETALLRADIDASARDLGPDLEKVQGMMVTLESRASAMMERSQEFQEAIKRFKPKRRPSSAMRDKPEDRAADGPAMGDTQESPSNSPE